MNYGKLAEIDAKQALAIGLVIAFIYLFVIPESIPEIEASIRSTRESLKQEQKLLNETEKASEDANRFQRESEMIGAQFKELIQYLPTETNTSQILQVLQREAGSAGAEIIKVQPAPKAEKKEFYEAASMDVELQGSYSQLVLFLSYLSKVPRLLTFNEVELTAVNQDAASPKVKFKGQLNSFRYIPDAANSPNGNSNNNSNNNSATKASPGGGKN
jgi:type IV pilus assembly protein PilO